MKKLLVSALMFLCLQSAFAAQYTTTKITNNNPPWVEPAVMANGDVAWYSGTWVGGDSTAWEVYVYKAQTKTVSQLTNNTVPDSIAGSNGRGDLLISSNVGPAGDRVASPELSLYDAASGNITLLGTGVLSADINEQGDVAWTAYDGNDFEIFLYRSATGTTTQLTNNDTDDLFTQWFYQYLNQHVLDNNGDVTWFGFDGVDTEIFVYTAATGTITQLTNNAFDDRNSTIRNGNIAWNGFNGTDANLFLYKGTTQSVTQLATNTSEYTMNANGDLLYWDDAFNLQRYNAASDSTTAITSDGQGGWKIQLNARGDAIWVAYSDVFTYDSASSTIHKISSVDSSYSTPRLSDNGDVTWISSDGTSTGIQEVFAFDAATQTTVQISTDLVDDGWPQISAHGDIAWPGLENGVWEIYLATKQTAVAQCEIVSLEEEFGGPVVANAINNLGQVLVTRNGGVFIWNNGSITPLTIAGITNPRGIDINDHGNVVVEAMADLNRRSYLWEDGVVTDLGTLGGWAVATKMNNNRQIIGWSHINGVAYAFLWNDGNLQNLGRNSASDINDAGQIGGRFNGAPAIWSNGLVTPIATVSPYQFIYGINNQGDTTGFAWFFGDYPTYIHAFVANVSDAKDLGTINGLSTWAGDINDDGVVVGYAWTSGIQRAFYTKDGVISLLDDKLPPDSGWDTLNNAKDINNAGQILGQGSKNGTTQTFVMSGACLQ